MQIKYFGLKVKWWNDLEENYHKKFKYYQILYGKIYYMFLYIFYGW